MLLADVRWAPLGLAACLAYAAYLWWQEKNITGLLRLAYQIGGQILVGVFIAAPVLLPLLEYSSLSTRQDLIPAENMVYSLPLPFLIGLLFPSTGGSHEYVIYPGAFALVMTIWIVALRPERKKTIFWLGWIILTLFLALGSNIPFMAAFAALPGLDLLRVPSRWLFLTGFGFAVMTAAGMQALFDGFSPTGVAKNVARGINPEFILWIIVFFDVAMTAGIWFMMQKIQLGMVIGCGSFVVLVILVVLWRRGVLNKTLSMVCFISISVINLGGVSLAGVQYRSTADVLAESQPAAQYLSNQTGLFRVYSPSYSLSQQTAANYHLELVDGIDPLQLSAYRDFIEKASGVINNSYSVTLPPFATGDPMHDNEGAIPDANLLGLLNTRFVAAEYPIENEDLVFLQQFGETRIYENKKVLPRAWVQAPSSSLGTDLLSIPEITYTANIIRLYAKGPGLLVLSEINYPGWEVNIDGKITEMQSNTGILRGVILNEGEHNVLFIYRPVMLYLGMGCAATLWGLIILYTFSVFKKAGTKNRLSNQAGALTEKKL
jgi:hypothetical protein